MTLFLITFQFVAYLLMLGFPCRERWSQICLKLGGVAGLAHLVFNHIAHQPVVLNRSSYIYYSGETTGLVGGVLLCLALGRQFGKLRNATLGKPAETEKV